MKRGDIVVAVAPGDYGKPRPHVVVQTDLLNETHASILACPITSDLRGYPYRLPLTPGPSTGLRQGSEAMVDKLQPIRTNLLISRSRTLRFHFYP